MTSHSRCHFTVLCAVLSVAFAFKFAKQRSVCDGVSQQCVRIFSCPAYQTRRDILNRRPVPCGFSGETPMVCCPDAASAAPATADVLAPSPSPPPSSLPEQCGDPFRVIQSTSHLPSLSIGGVDPELGKWPWMVLFGRRTDAGLGGWFCGGTLITDRHVLTAAHCLPPEQAGTVGALIGDHNLRTSAEVSHQERNISHIVQHPQFVGAQNDLAVVLLEAPVEMSDAVWPICLPPAGAEHPGRQVQVAGWGLSESTDQPSAELQELQLEVIDSAACQHIYRRVPQFDARFPGGFQGTKICAGSRDGPASEAVVVCPSDPGGPLMAQMEDFSYQLVGVWSIGLEPCGSVEFPSIYTKVSAYIDWIVGSLT